jgi:hypothetical protein
MMVSTGALRQSLRAGVKNQFLSIFPRMGEKILAFCGQWREDFFLSYLQAHTGYQFLETKKMI